MSDHIFFSIPAEWFEKVESMTHAEWYRMLSSQKSGIEASYSHDESQYTVYGDLYAFESGEQYWLRVGAYPKKKRSTRGCEFQTWFKCRDDKVEELRKKLEEQS